jgi:hypothetical protein
MATLEQLERALVNADKAGDGDAARKLAAVITRARQDSSNRIPGTDVAGTTATAPEPGLGEKVVGAGEAALTALTGATGGMVGMLGAGGAEVARQVAGAIQDPQGYKPTQTVEQAAMGGAQALTYEPRTQAGRGYVEDVVVPAGQALVPLAGLAGTMPAIQGVRSNAPVRVLARAGAEGVARDLASVAGPAAGDLAATAVSRTIDTAGRAAEAGARGARNVTTLPRRALAALSRDEAATPTPGTMGSAGAAGTDLAAQRIATAESIGLTGDAALTKGQATRDPAQLKFEVESAKNMELGGGLRERRVAQNEALLNTIERDIDVTGSTVSNLRQVGEAVDAPLVRQYRADKAVVNENYGKARRSPEAAAIVDQAASVTIGEGDRAITSTPIEYINSQPNGLPNTAVTDAARQYAVKLGIADLADGQLVPRPATIQQLETWRTAISESIDSAKAPDLRHGTILKGLIDGQTEPVAGPLYRIARNSRTRLAQNYEDRSVVAKLLAKKPGTQDRAVALEDVFEHAILKGSLDDVRNVQRVMLRSGPDGAQGWRELRGQTLKWIRDEATTSATTDSANNRVLSPAGLEKAIKKLDQDGKLDRIFGKLGAQRLRDINDVAQIAKTVPPEAAINWSNTAMTLLSASGDLAASLFTGIPAPIATATRVAAKHIADKRLRARINDALDNLQRQGAANPP